MIGGAGGGCGGLSHGGGGGRTSASSYSLGLGLGLGCEEIRTDAVDDSYGFYAQHDRKEGSKESPRESLMLLSHTSSSVGNANLAGSINSSRHMSFNSGNSNTLKGSKGGLLKVSQSSSSQAGVTLTMVAEERNYDSSSNNSSPKSSPAPSPSGQSSVVSNFSFSMPAPSTSSLSIYSANSDYASGGGCGDNSDSDSDMSGSSSSSCKHAVKLRDIKTKSRTLVKRSSGDLLYAQKKPRLESHNSNGNSKSNSYSYSYSNIHAKIQTDPASLLERDSDESYNNTMSPVKIFHVPGVSITESDKSPIKVDTRSFADFGISSIIGGSFRVISVLGRGIFGNVFQCKCLKDSDLATASTAALYGSVPNLLAPSTIFPSQIGHTHLCKANEIFAVKVARMADTAVKSIESEYEILKSVSKSTSRETYVVRAYGKFDIHRFTDVSMSSLQEEKSMDGLISLGRSDRFYSGTAIVLESMKGDVRSLYRLGVLSRPFCSSSNNNSNSIPSSISEGSKLHILSTNSEPCTPSGIPWRRFNLFMYHLVQAVSNLHKCTNYIHLDIKPENVLVNESMTIFKLCDFGSALKVDVAQEQCKSQAKEGVANMIPRYYRPPEVILGCSDILTTKADIWSLAVTFLEMYNKGGQFAFPAKDNFELLASIFEVYQTKLPASFVLSCAERGDADMRTVLKEKLVSSSNSSSTGNGTGSSSVYSDNGLVYIAKQTNSDGSSSNNNSSSDSYTSYSSSYSNGSYSSKGGGVGGRFTNGNSGDVNQVNDLIIKISYISPTSGIKCIDHTISNSLDTKNSISNVGSGGGSSGGGGCNFSKSRSRFDSRNDLERISVVSQSIRDLLQEKTTGAGGYSSNNNNNNNNSDSSCTTNRQLLRSLSNPSDQKASGISIANVKRAASSNNLTSNKLSYSSRSKVHMSNSNSNSVSVSNSSTDTDTDTDISVIVHSYFESRFLKVIQRMLTIDPNDRISADKLVEVMELEFLESRHSHQF